MKDLIGTLEQGTYAEQAALIYLENHRAKLLYYKTITEVFDALQNNKIKKGILPLTNSISGFVKETLKNIGKYRINIEQNVILPIEHGLACLKGTKKEKIEIIMSHPQAISQCTSYINKNYKNCKLIGTKNTAYALKQISREKIKNAAAIGSRHTIKKYNLKIISKNISNKKDNNTLFGIITLI